MRIKIKFKLTIFLISILFINNIFAQEALKPRLSPLEIVTVKYESTYIKVTYGRPHKKGREIFGDLVPYGVVWRTGANEATEITFTDDVLINKHRLKAGTYTIFTIPEKDKWKVMFNSDLGQWGAYNYNPAKNILEIDAEVAEMDIIYEPFTIEFQIQDDKTNLLMMWDKTKASFTINFLE
ncbi:MAG: DUF2911 domain-containing protein [Cyclobacteriaceae bacterium]|nr:DUF2911 domain-containing protein [Cyclobacteriaceae bacterium]